MSTMKQHDLFGAVQPSLPDGFRYSPDVVPDDLQQSILEKMLQLPFKAFDFHGFEGKRRTVSYGWKYEFDTQRVRKSEDIPLFLLPLRKIVSAFAGLDPDRLEQTLVTEYSPGAPIGWHRDKFVFGRVVGVSLLSACTFRLRRRQGSKWQRSSITLEPRSAYVMAGEARTVWEHSIPPVAELRYSITFRELSPVT
ncbi:MULTISPECIES: alpha-ketoglutarate-dependent dioxygenase AlkB [Rhizobium]|jgi:alkylated DNA repair dioxygenase AlkB|uniref:Alpha-ketoglutarate-dependent dioxygenase AlkB n=1 Tax=Rhizobium anhuiense TaxID=1184720 RepID=A0A432NXW2_9HYPH|nr:MULTISPECIES: alpha-ketoglutarate-dependent dioxygenase AlkB [Rhizobium]MBB3741969.1 alkylated DNA repair dioxygenase AlkB [Rhizobium sp. BK591]MBB4252024.1 alkylated DNA repair dioxygenase AlkB [Rhizobium sp. BK008]PDS55505.1 alpha-ketoglutarate-dependent dioxygenase AlkB [Rhizobium anhuiense]RUM04491.1 alpha-ketoglutarate-dependent dioxygenase AlkB [Rhizobium anhuiense]UTS88360.1 alpha-ketoglutarate-dependent dioxygenase AlkB [Rhizobium anhuiense bv. trifolii]